MSQDLPRRLLVATGVQDPPDDTTQVVEALRVAVEEVVVPGIGLELDWETYLVTPADDLERGIGRRSRGRDWDLLLGGASRLEVGSLVGRRAGASPTLPPDLTASPVSVRASVLPGRPATLAWSVHEWAVVDWPAFVQQASTWLLTRADALGLGSGWIGLDVADAADPVSPWEAAVGVSPGERDLERYLWGYGWGTLLSATHAELVGGAQALASLPGAEVRTGPGGRVWLRLGPDPRNLDRAQVRVLRDLLHPVLPAGIRTVEEYFDTSNPYASPLPYLL